jgi:hypothetical protein
VGRADLAEGDRAVVRLPEVQPGALSGVRCPMEVPSGPENGGYQNRALFAHSHGGIGSAFVIAPPNG